MKYFNKLLLAGIIIATVMFSVESFAGDPFKKLGRGVANIAFGGLEMLKQPCLVARKDGEIAGITYGVFKGVGYTVARISVGVVDVVTFLIPLPNCPDDELDTGWGYGPLMRPEWIFTKDENAYNFFYNDEALPNN